MAGNYSDQVLAREALDSAFKSKIEVLFQTYYQNVLASESTAHGNFMAGLKLARTMHAKAMADIEAETQS